MTVLGIIAAALLFPTAEGEGRTFSADDLQTVVYFDYGATELGTIGEQLVDKVARTALESGFSQAVATGHADRAGPKGQNHQTGLERAEAVAARLIDAGFVSDNVRIESVGEMEPAIVHEDERREPRNRRVVIEFAGDTIE